MILGMEMVHSFTIMELVILGNGKMIDNMEKDLKNR